MPEQNSTTGPGNVQKSPRVNEHASLNSSVPTSVAPLANSQPQASVLVNNAIPDGAPDVPDTPLDSDQPMGDHGETNRSIGLLRGILCVVAFSGLIFLQATNMSMLTTVQGTIAEELEAYNNTSWFTSSYLIAMSALGPLNGKLCSIFAPRFCIFVASILFALGTVISGVASNFEAFIAGRVVTGMGASGVLTIAIVVVLELTDAKRRGLGVGLLNSGFTIGVSLGAVVSGALVPAFGWRPLFWLQAPISLVSGTVLLIAIPSEFKASGSPKPLTDDASTHTTFARLRTLDYFGALTLTAAITLLLYSLSSPTTIPLYPLLLSFVILAIFVGNEAFSASDPIIPITLLRSRGLLLTCLGTTGFMMARWSVLFFSPTYALTLQNWSRAGAGAILIPTNAGFAIGGLLVGALHIRRPGSFYLPTLVAYALFPITLALLAGVVRLEGPAWSYVLVIALCGATTGAALNYNLAHLLHLTPPETHYVATALIATFRGFAGSFGSAIGGGLFARALDRALKQGFAERGMMRDRLVRRLLGTPELVNELAGVEREVAREGYVRALSALFGAAAGLAAVVWFVQAGTGWRAPGERGLVGERRPLLGEENEDEDGEANARHRGDA